MNIIEKTAILYAIYIFSVIDDEEIMKEITEESYI